MLLSLRNLLCVVVRRSGVFCHVVRDFVARLEAGVKLDIGDRYGRDRA